MRRVSIGTLLMMLLVPTTARAYRTLADDPTLGTSQPIGWSTPHVRFVIADPDGTGADALELEEPVRQALETWSSVECSSYEAEYAGPYGEHAAPGDGLNTIEIVRTGWEARGFEPGQVATSDIEVRRSSWDDLSIVEADVYLNFNDYAAVYSDDSSVGAHAVLTHELGHCAGVAHPCGDPGAPLCATATAFRESVVYPEYTGRTALSTDDAAAMCWLYPLAPATCDCELGEVCVAGECRTASCEGESCVCRDALDCDPGLGCALAGDAIGQCMPEGEFGVPCVAGNDCRSRLCVTGSFPSFCTAECFWDRQCSEDLVCRAVDGRHVCAPPVGAGGCSAHRGRSSPLWGTALLALLAAVAGRRRR